MRVWGQRKKGRSSPSGIYSESSLNRLLRTLLLCRGLGTMRNTMITRPIQPGTSFQDSTLAKPTSGFPSIMLSFTSPIFLLSILSVQAASNMLSYKMI